MSTSNTLDTSRGPSAPAFVDMTSAEFALCLSRLQWQQLDCAQFFDVTTRTVYRWGTGASPIPRPIAMLLRVMCARTEPLPPDALLSAASLVPGASHA